jgi:hypothetical protein
MKYQSTIASFGLILASTEIVSSFVQQNGTPSISLRSRQECNTDHDVITTNSNNNNNIMRNSKTSSLSIATSDIVGELVEDLKKKKTREVRFHFILFYLVATVLYCTVLFVVDDHVVILFKRNTCVR